MSSVTTAQLQADVDQCVTLLNTPWKAPLMFKVAITSSRTPDRATIESTLQMQDITTFLGGQKPEYLRLYFDPRKYQTRMHSTNKQHSTGLEEVAESLLVAQQDDCTNNKTTTTNTKVRQPPAPPDFLILKKDLENAALQDNNEEEEIGSGQFPLFSNGSSGGCLRTRRFHCAGCINRANTKRNMALSKKRQELKHTFRCSDIINDKKRNSRGPGGKSMIRRTTSVVSNRSCTFGFTVRWDEIGFYVSLEKKSGCPLHTFHSPANNAYSIPTRLLADDEQETLDHLAASCCTTGVGGSYIRSKLGRFMSKGKVAYIYSQARRKDRSTNTNTNDESGVVMSEYDHLTKYFESTQEIAYTVLWDVVPTVAAPPPPCDNQPQGAEKVDVVAATPVNPAGPLRWPKPTSLLLSHTKLDNLHSCQKDHTEDDSMGGLRKEGLICRDLQQVGDDTKIFLAIAWVFKPELRFFKLFPEVIHVDATSHSTHKKYELLTFSVKTSLGRQVVFLRVWLPDQRRYSFRWVFQHVLTGLIPQEFFLRTRLVMSDGDRQQQMEIEAAIRNYMPNARLGSCGWHIVDRGWRRNGPSSNAFQRIQKKKQVQALYKVVRQWIYSWMRPGYCETEDEYQVSLRLLNKFIDSPRFHTTVDGRLDIIAHVKQFLRENILVHNDLFLHYFRRETRFLDIAHNSAHEGTNHGMKANAAAVLPVLSPVAAAERMVVQATVTTQKLEEESYRTLQQKKLWSSLPTSAHVVQIAESILLKQVERYANYAVVRVGYSSFEVAAVQEDSCIMSQGNDVDSDQLPIPSLESVTGAGGLFGSDEEHDNETIEIDEEDHHEGLLNDVTAASSAAIRGNCPAVTTTGVTSSCGPIPLFRRTRTVLFDVNRCAFTCSCCQFERIGIPCVHVYSVVKCVNPSWKGFTHHQLSVRWWSIYIAKGYPSGTSCPTSRALASLASNDLAAPVMPGFCKILDDCAQTICARSTAPGLAWERVTNYAREDLQKIFTEYRRRDAGEWDFMGHSQTTYNPAGTDEEEEIASFRGDGFDMISDPNQQQEEGGKGGTAQANDGGPSCNLFERFDLHVAVDNNSNYALIQRKLQSFLSLYLALGEDEKNVASDRVDTLLSQTRADYAKNQPICGGTRSILVEQHCMRSRTYNTHNPYYK
jgi:MULE transposase domain